ncbi:anti-sigma factor antagonist [Stutzerimonas stutzeri]|uniref:Anti-sigma factor antagonist n=1 Tax=Stutzerimonas stutzeri TaxID=316 RepID=W8R1E0_STUST|nr:STAS domain-containing protein [Stutzerimonas stutzeri]AHL76715.1 anti-sigma factor antagonist [Stutzerimonas stutzeri]MCQ4331127.1 STAS domain-containing protein [Stutzerimonas stutzeri]
MSETRVEGGASGELRLFGVLDYQSGPALRRAGQDLIREGKGQRLLIDCSSVEKSSSVGLSLLLAFTRDAIGAGREVAIVGMPGDMREIARVSGLLDVLSLADETEGVA